MNIHRRDTSQFRPGWVLLDRVADSLPLRSIERDIVVCALLYLEGDLKAGGTVARWWHQMDAKEAA